MVLTSALLKGEKLYSNSISSNADVCWGCGVPIKKELRASRSEEGEEGEGREGGEGGIGV